MEEEVNFEEGKIVNNEKGKITDFFEIYPCYSDNPTNIVCPCNDQNQLLKSFFFGHQRIGNKYRVYVKTDGSVKVAYYNGFSQLDGKIFFECSFNDPSTYEFIYKQKNSTFHDESFSIKDFLDNVELTKNYVPRVNLNKTKCVTLQFQNPIKKLYYIDNNIFTRVQNQPRIKEENISTDYTYEFKKKEKIISETQDEEKNLVKSKELQIKILQERIEFQKSRLEDFFSSERKMINNYEDMMSNQKKGHQEEIIKMNTQHQEEIKKMNTQHQEEMKKITYSFENQLSFSAKEHSFEILQMKNMIEEQANKIAELKKMMSDENNDKVQAIDSTNIDCYRKPSESSSHFNRIRSLKHSKPNSVKGSEKSGSLESKKSENENKLTILPKQK